MSELDDLRRALIEIRDAWDDSVGDDDLKWVHAVGDAIDHARPLIEHTPPPRWATSSAAARFTRLADAISRAWLVEDRDLNRENIRRAFVGVAYRAIVDSDVDTALRARAIYTALEVSQWHGDWPHSN